MAYQRRNHSKLSTNSDCHSWKLFDMVLLSVQIGVCVFQKMNMHQFYWTFESICFCYANYSIYIFIKLELLNGLVISLKFPNKPVITVVELQGLIQNPFSEFTPLY